MKNLISTRVASIIYAITIAIFGVRNIVKADSMDIIVPSYIPGGIVWMYVTGVCMVLAAIAIVLNNSFTTLACYLLALMLIIFICMLHVKSAMDGNPGNLLKDVAIAMGAIIIGNLAPHRGKVL